MSKQLFDRTGVTDSILARLAQMQIGQASTHEDRETYEFPNSARYENAHRNEVQVLCSTRADSLYEAALLAMHKHAAIILGDESIKLLIAKQAGKMSEVSLRQAIRAYNRDKLPEGQLPVPVYALDTTTHVGPCWAGSVATNVYISGYAAVTVRREG